MASVGAVRGHTSTGTARPRLETLPRSVESHGNRTGRERSSQSIGCCPLGYRLACARRSLARCRRQRIPSLGSKSSMVAFLPAQQRYPVPCQYTFPLLALAVLLWPGSARADLFDYVKKPDAAYHWEI